MIPDSLDYSQIVELDKRFSHGHENPDYEGLAVLSRKQVQALLAWIDEHCTPGAHTYSRATSDDLARFAANDLHGVCKKVTNLQIKTAMYLSGYAPAVEPVTLWYFLIEFRRR